MTHIGIRLRITAIHGGVVYDCDSDMAHLQAALIDAHGWTELTAGLIGPFPIKVEIKPVQLTEVPDDDEDQADTYECTCANCSGCTGEAEPDPAKISAGLLMIDAAATCFGIKYPQQNAR